MMTCVIVIRVTAGLNGLWCRFYGDDLAAREEATIMGFGMILHGNSIISLMLFVLMTRLVNNNLMLQWHGLFFKTGEFR